MRRVGIVLIVAGILTGIAGLTIVAYSVVRFFDKKSVVSIPVAVGIETKLGNFHLIPDKPSRISISMDVATKSIKTEMVNEKTEYKPQYKFGVTYKITGENGNLITLEDRFIEWDRGMKAVEKVNAGKTYATLTVKKGFPTFKVPPPGIVGISVVLRPDKDYGAVATNAVVRVYENLPQLESFIAIGVLMIMAGPIVFVTGLIVLIIGITRKNSTLHGGIKPQEALIYGGRTPESASSNASLGRMIPKPTADETVLSVICHLAPLAGTITLVGHVLIPLAVLLTKGKESEFIAYNARESLNFQLSMTIYWICTVLLMFVLIGLLLAVPLAVFELSIMIKASIKASRGERYRVPFCMRFIK